MKFRNVVLIIVLWGFSTPVFLHSQAEVLLVLGSDTAIWDGLNTSNYNCHFNFDLYTNPTFNGYKVMDSEFRSKQFDSYGQTVKLTWWMMAGNTYRFADNRNIPLPNTMTLYLMKKYHGDAIKQFGDELSLHYHTFFWSDYDADGKYYWNQAHSFTECREDFDITLAQYLLEENVYPVSFRSGWHYMDNEWQQYLDQLLLFSMHNDYPHVRTETEEPIDNVYDWSKAPKTFIPYQPAPYNYQLPGGTRGWNLRSVYMASVAQSTMDNMFAEAKNGKTQVACFWAHLPEEDFLDNVARIDSIAHQSAAKYPTVKFRYCSAIEAMQRWLKTSDTTSPAIQIEENPSNDKIKFIVKTDENIFQTQPFAAIKNIYEQYLIVNFTKTGNNTWESVEDYDKEKLAKFGIAVADTVGNLSTKFIKYLPDDIFIDNNDKDYSELNGSWTTSQSAAWGHDSRILTLKASDSVAVKWNINVEKSGNYNLFVQVPELSNSVTERKFKIGCGSNTHFKAFNDAMTQMDWVYIGTYNFNQNENNYLEMSATGKNQSGKIFSADVLKITPLVRDVELKVNPDKITFGLVCAEDSASTSITISNNGIKDLVINYIKSFYKYAEVEANFPLVIHGMKTISLPLKFYSSTAGTIEDYIIISSNDPVNPVMRIPLLCTVLNYFVLVDNEDSENYKEYGTWNFSNAHAYGNTSRYANQNLGASAVFTSEVKKSGLYEVLEIVPTTVNATDKALYIISENNVPLDSVFVNQNTGSGSWVSIGQYNFRANSKVSVKVVDVGLSTVGTVIRADAIRVSLIQETTGIDELSNLSLPEEFGLEQNFPNPFNPTTKIKYSIPVETRHASSLQNVQLKVYDILGNEVAALVNEEQPAGEYEVEFNGNQLSSGVYFYKLSVGQYSEIRKMVYMK